MGLESPAGEHVRHTPPSVDQSSQIRQEIPHRPGREAGRSVRGRALAHRYERLVSRVPGRRGGPRLGRDEHLKKVATPDPWKSWGALQVASRFSSPCEP